MLTAETAACMHTAETAARMHTAETAALDCSTGLQGSEGLQDR